MSQQSSVVRNKKSPCCIGCLVIGLLTVGAIIILCIFLYRFARENVSMINVVSKIDPLLSASPDDLLPKEAGNFKRVDIKNAVDSLPFLGDLQTTVAHVAVYRDNQGNSISVSSLPTTELNRHQKPGMEAVGNGKDIGTAGSAIKIRNPFTENEHSDVTVVWAKPNWTYIVRTTSTLAEDFVADFQPGKSAVDSGVTTQTVTGTSAPISSGTAVLTTGTVTP